ncbi:MAG: hypothetical protein M1339_06505, partial [Bacteroidetes bacterium]|nr:hypothetical protein [Bacteroidota bacterium]
FDITNGTPPEKMYPGLIIEYKVSPLLGIKTTWVTEITHVKEYDRLIKYKRRKPKFQFPWRAHSAAPGDAISSLNTRPGAGKL